MALRSNGIHVFAVGIEIINSFELFLISGDARRVFTVENLDALKTIERSIVSQVCESEHLPGQGKQRKHFVGCIIANNHMATCSPR